MTTKLEGGGCKAFVAGPLKKELYFFAASLTRIQILFFLGLDPNPVIFRGSNPDPDQFHPDPDQFHPDP